MKKDKIKAMLSLKNLNMSDYAVFLGKSRQHISNKNKSDVWSLDEAIQLAELTNTQLCFLDKETGNVLISFDSNDIKKDTQQ